MTETLLDEFLEHPGRFRTYRVPVQPGLPNQRQRTRFDAREYVLVFRWSQRESKWYLDLRDAKGELLVGCIKLVVHWPLLEQRRGQRSELPPGELVLVDGRSPARDPSLDELGDVVSLLYVARRPAIPDDVSRDYERDAHGRVVVVAGQATLITTRRVYDYDDQGRPVVVDVIQTSVKVPAP